MRVARDGWEHMEVAINAQLVSFGQSYRNAGVSRYAQTLLEALGSMQSTTEERAEQHYWVFINASETAAAKESELGGRPNIALIPSRHPITSPARRVVWEQFVLPRELRRVGADVFHAPVNVLPSRVPCPSVVTIHDLAFYRYPEYFRPSRRIYQRMLTSRSARRATLIAAVSQSTKRDIVAFLRVPEDRVEVIYTALGCDFRPVRDTEQLAAFRAAHHLPERYMLYLGTLEPRKNLERLVTAYASLRAERPETPPLVIAGAKGWYFQPLFERVRALGAENAITFVGYVSREEQPLWYSAARAFLYPSLYEGFGLPVLEALACGTPTLTSSISSLPEAAGDVALQVSPTDTDALVQGMRRLLEDERLRARIAVEGPEWASSFTREHMAQRYAGLYERAAQRGGGVAGKRKG